MNRFCSDNKNYKKSDIQNYLVSAICKLFPSQGLDGLGIFPNHPYNFGNILSSSNTIDTSPIESKDLLILAKMLVCCANKNNVIKGIIKVNKDKKLFLENSEIKTKLWKL